MSNHPVRVIAAVVALAAGVCACASPRIEPPMMVAPLRPRGFVQDGDTPTQGAPAPVTKARVSAPASTWEPWQDTFAVEVDVGSAWAVGVGLGLRDVERRDALRAEDDAAVHGVALWLSFSF